MEKKYKSRIDEIMNNPYYHRPTNLLSPAEIEKDTLKPKELYFRTYGAGKVGKLGTESRPGDNYMKGSQESKEQKEKRLRKRKNNLAKLDSRHKKAIKLIKAKDWVGYKKFQKKYEPEEYKLNEVYAKEDLN